MPVKVYDGTNWVTVAGDGAAGAPGAAATSSSITTWVKTASGGETSVSGTGDTGYGTLAYTVGQELVYLNGVLLDRGDDYTATNGTSITGLTALLANDIVTVWTVNSFSVANTYTIAQADAAFAPISVVSGLTLVASTTISAATSISVNNCFTSTYANYLLVIDVPTTTGTAGYVTLRLRASGTDTTTNYGCQKLIAVNTTVSASRDTTWTPFYAYPTDPGFAGTIELFRPNMAEKTVYKAHTGYGSDEELFLHTGQQTSSTQFDGFTLTGTATLTGTIRVYGYRNS